MLLPRIGEISRHLVVAIVPFWTFWNRDILQVWGFDISASLARWTLKLRDLQLMRSRRLLGSWKPDLWNHWHHEINRSWDLKYLKYRTFEILIPGALEIMTPWAFLATKSWRLEFPMDPWKTKRPGDLKSYNLELVISSHLQMVHSWSVGVPISWHPEVLNTWAI